ncbi:unnamed protein product, partial [Rotaria sp. Silwood1]
MNLSPHMKIQNINSRHQYPSQYMLPSYMQGSNGIIFNMNNFSSPSDQYTNKPMLPDVHKQYGAVPSDSYGQLPPCYPQNQTGRYGKEMNMEHVEDEGER